jgi:hypothetical protein
MLYLLLKTACGCSFRVNSNVRWASINAPRFSVNLFQSACLSTLASTQHHEARCLSARARIMCRKGLEAQEQSKRSKRLSHWCGTCGNGYHCNLMEFMMERHLPVQAPNIYTSSAVSTMVETNELSLFFQGLGEFPSHVYIRKEDTIVYELIMTRAMSQCVRRVGRRWSGEVDAPDRRLSVAVATPQY